MAENVFLLAGLGNPGRTYENTRHNVGFDTIELFSEKHGIAVNKSKHRALIGEGAFKGKKVVLAKPQTYMNLSGESIRDIIEWYRIPLQNAILIYDDTDLPAGRIRIRPKGSSGTHNGMKSVIYHLRSEEFPRIRIGIGAPSEGWDLAAYVLGKFGKEERKTVDESIIMAVKAAEAIIESGVESAMNLFNRRMKDAGPEASDND